MLDTAAYVASPVAIDVTSFDPVWPTSDMPDDKALLFNDMPMKQMDMRIVTDEDAWLFGGDKLGVSVSDIRITTDVKPKLLSIEVPNSHNQDEEDATSMLLEQIMGSPVDELDAMTAFIVDHVDPFQEVVFTSDDEPMSPASSPVRMGMSTSELAMADKRRLAKLKASIAHLEKMYYARCHSNMSANRVKMVRGLQRLQRVACNIARENFAFRTNKLPQRVREEVLLQELKCALQGVVMSEQIEKAVADKLCTNAIVNTARRAAESALSLAGSHTDEVMGWQTTKSYDQSSGLMGFTFQKELSLESPEQFQRICSMSWELLVSSEQFAQLMRNGSRQTIRSHVIKRLSGDAVLVSFDTVVADAEIGSVRVERDVCVAFRVRTATGMLVGISSMSPSLFQSSVHALDGVQFVENGMRWIQFSSKTAQTENGTKDRMTVVAGGRMHCASPSAAATAHVDALSLTMLWERHVVAPVFTL